MRVSLVLRVARGSTFVLLGGVLALLPSCNSLFGFDEYSDSTSDLCDLAQKCYDFADCESHVGPKLDGADADTRSEWLAAIPTKSCLASCAKSRKCLNIDPVCNGLGSACEREEECCGFLSGKARCRPLAGASGGDAGTADGPKQCCLPDGVQTEQPNACCSGIYNPKNKACGQNVCRPEGIECTDHLQCCSQICRDGKCAEEQCLPLDTPCGPSDVCCDGAECLATTGACGFAQECRTLRAPCDVAGQKAPCCAGLECKAALNKHPSGELYDGLCQPPDAVCMPKGYACESEKCCDGLTCRNGECKPPCVGVDEACSDNGDCCSGKCEVTQNGPVCKCAQIYCELPNDCCSGICVGGVCTAACATKSVCHDECVAGPALVAADAGSCPQVDKACLGNVCKADPFCCCVEWDATCVVEAVTLCGTTVCN